MYDKVHHLDFGFSIRSAIAKRSTYCGNSLRLYVRLSIALVCCVEKQHFIELFTIYYICYYGFRKAMY